MTRKLTGRRRRVPADDDDTDDDVEEDDDVQLPKSKKQKKRKNNGREVVRPSSLVRDSSMLHARLVVWSSGRASVFGQCAFAVLCSTCS